MNKSAKKNRDIATLNEDELRERLAEALSYVPRKGKKFRYGAHFSVALLLFEKLTGDLGKVEETIEFLQTEHHNSKALYKTFRRACVESFHHVEKELREHLHDLKDVKDRLDIKELDRENYHMMQRRYSTLSRLIHAMRMVDIDADDVEAFRALQESQTPECARLIELFEPLKGPAITHPRRLSQLALSGLASNGSGRGRRASRSP